MDRLAFERRTGWRVHHHALTDSTNDDAAALRDAGAPARTLVLADAQRTGRGREGRRFASPAGGLYVSLLVTVPREHVPQGLVALAAVAAAESAEALAAVRVDIKWPNDLWIGGAKVGGILVEAADADLPATIGLGMNLRAVPSDLDARVRAETTAVDLHAAAPIDRVLLLEALVGRIDTWCAALTRPGGGAELEAAWLERVQLIGGSVVLTYRGARREGVLEAVSLTRGLCLREGGDRSVWLPGNLVQDLRPA